MTYGEWVNEELGWHQTEHILSSLNCGREYHVYVVLFNALGASPASQVLTTRTLGNRPTAPTSSYDFILANTVIVPLAKIMSILSLCRPALGVLQQAGQAHQIQPPQVQVEE